MPEQILIEQADGTVAVRLRTNQSFGPTQRQAVEEWAGGYCEYCRSPVKYGVQSFECEHIVPISQGGETMLDNLAFACDGCNRCKAAHTVVDDPKSGRTVPLFHPRGQRWADHFVWNHDFTLLHAGSD